MKNQYCFHATPKNNKDSIQEKGLKPSRNRIWACRDRKTAKKWAREHLTTDAKEFILLEIPLKEPYHMIPKRKNFPSEIAIDSEENISFEEIVIVEEFTK